MILSDIHIEITFSIKGEEVYFSIVIVILIIDDIIRELQYNYFTNVSVFVPILNTQCIESITTDNIQLAPWNKLSIYEQKERTNLMRFVEINHIIIKESIIILVNYELIQDSFNLNICGEIFTAIDFMVIFEVPFILFP